MAQSRSGLDSASPRGVPEDKVMRRVTDFVMMIAVGLMAVAVLLGGIIPYALRLVRTLS